MASKRAKKAILEEKNEHFGLKIKKNEPDLYKMTIK